MKYDVISADCHVDLIWLPPDLFTANAPGAVKERMPYVADGPRGKEWVTKNGSSFGLMNGMGWAGRKYEPAKIHRSDRMPSTGLYADGEKGIRRLTDPDLRLKEQDRDGVQAEVLYGILGATNRLNDNEAAGTMLRIYNDWLADFCGHHPERFAGLANIPNHSVEEAVSEIERVAKRGNVRGLEIARRHDMTPLWDPWWNPVWDAIAASGLPVHFHTIGGAGGGLSEVDRQDPARSPRRQHFELPDAHGRRLDVDDLRRRAAPPTADEDGDRRGRHRLDPLYSRPHGRRVGGPVQGTRPHDEAERVLAAPVLRDLSERPRGGEADRGVGRRQHHV